MVALAVSALTVATPTKDVRISYRPYLRNTSGEFVSSEGYSF